MLTTPARSDHSPPSPAIAMGTDSPTAAATVPADVRSSAPVTMRTKDNDTITPRKISAIPRTPRDRELLLRSLTSTVGSACGCAERLMPLLPGE